MTECTRDNGPGPENVPGAEAVGVVLFPSYPT